LFDLVSGDADDSIPLCLKVFFPKLVVQSLILLHMHASVNLNDQLVFMAAEVGDISSDGVLTPKFQPSELAASQTRPEKGLSLSLLLPKFSGEAKYVRRRF
jgi:hypothetical protein